MPCPLFQNQSNMKFGIQKPYLQCKTCMGRYRGGGSPPLEDMWENASDDVRKLVSRVVLGAWYSNHSDAGLV